MKKTLVCITGPTASGKTALAIKLALHYKTEIVSFDSRQFYKELKIGAAPPSTEELKSVPHHFIFCRSITEPYNAATYAADAKKKISELFETFDVVVMVGGSGLYLNALLHGLDEMPQVLPEVRNTLQEKLQREGIGVLQQELQQADPEYFSEVDIHNPVRLIRALEVIRSSGRKYSEFRKNKIKDTHTFQSVQIFLNPPREALYARINQRVDGMIQQGLLEEVRSLFPFKNYKALDTVGYKELFEYLEGHCSLQEAIDKIKQHTRNYAKRQVTWFKRNKKNLELIEPNIDEVFQFLENQ
ncbi:MAG: tRNA (adenosine(37)-N6)-dimethylallyltransferase MiaA [Flavobacteriales bacterium]|nr:tRNA (adenosine(37)-N6)-dimethylallyltransferase MiaA [Flavobacteriales bacterium]